MFAIGKPTVLALLLGLALNALPAQAAAADQSQLVAQEIRSKHFSGNKIGTNPVRKLAIYLPPGYERETRRYPVVYFFANPFDSSFRAIFDKVGTQAAFDRAIATGIIGKFIFVTVDMKTPVGSSWFVNSPVTGNWEDFVVQELVPYIDANFRTLPTRDSRGIAGQHMGGYGAIRFGMKYPQVFGTVYAMHPVGTGSGVKIVAELPDWNLMENAKTLKDVERHGASAVFTTMFQAHLPNPDKPPLYIDMPAHGAGDDLSVDAKTMDRFRENFFLDSAVGRYADNLKSLRGFKMDWARSDLNFDHVYAVQALTHKYNEYGIRHEAEEFNGTWPGDDYWSENGRITTDVLPFFQRHLAF